MIEIIPAIDLIEGRCVRLSQGDFSRVEVYGDDPVEVARRFAAAGLHRLHIVDLDGTRRGGVTNLKVLEAISTRTDLTIDFGGGIKTTHDLQSVFDAGAAIASIGSVAVKDPETFFGWIEEYGGEKILLGADVRDGSIRVDGWQTATRSEIVPFLSEHFTNGVRRAFVTDIAKDGLLRGPSIELYKQILEALPDLELIASGGVSNMGDTDQLEMIGCHGVIVGKAIYEEKISLAELAAYNENVSQTNNSLS